MNDRLAKIPKMKLRQFSMDILKEAGLNLEDANILSESLVEADLRGLGTHGISRLPIYVKRIKEGLINPRPEMLFHQRSDTTGILDGDNGPGQIVAYKAMNKAIDVAKNKGVGFVACKNSNHFGACAYYVQMALQHHMIGVGSTNAEPSMVPFGGRRPFFGTNPIAAAIPSPRDFPLIIDMATSKVARGNIIKAARENTIIPPDWALDSHGNPTTDPEEALEGAVLPMEGPKGYCLAFLVEVFTSLLAGSLYGPHIQSMYKEFEKPQNVSHFLGAIAIDSFLPKEEFLANIDRMIQELKSIPPQSHSSQVLIPGEIEHQKREKNLIEGIKLSPLVLKELDAIYEGISLKDYL